MVEVAVRVGNSFAGFFRPFHLGRFSELFFAFVFRSIGVPFRWFFSGRSRLCVPCHFFVFYVEWSALCYHLCRSQVLLCLSLDCDDVV